MKGQIGGGSHFIEHALLILGMLMVVMKFMFGPLGIPASFLYPEIFICAVFLWIGLLDIATPLGSLIITGIIVIALLLL